MLSHDQINTIEENRPFMHFLLLFLCNNTLKKIADIFFYINFVNFMLLKINISNAKYNILTFDNLSAQTEVDSLLI